MLLRCLVSLTQGCHSSENSLRKILPRQQKVRELIQYICTCPKIQIWVQFLLVLFTVFDRRKCCVVFHFSLFGTCTCTPEASKKNLLEEYLATLHNFQLYNFYYTFCRWGTPFIWRVQNHSLKCSISAWIKRQENSFKALKSQKAITASGDFFLEYNTDI